MSHVTITKPTDIEIPKVSRWAKLPLIGGVMAVVGLGATLGMSFGAHGDRAMFSYLWAFEALLGIALGGLGFVLIEHTARSGWSSGVRRLGETAMATLPLFALLFIPIATLGMHDLYPWTHETDPILERKRWFLTTPFFYGRAVVYFVIWTVVGRLLYTWSTKQDSVTTLEERTALTHKMWKLSAGALFLYGLSQSFAAIDWVMSLQPHWYSTIFGVYYFAGSILSFFAFTILVSLGLQRAGLIKNVVTAEHYHDLGKYLFGYTVFWAYIAFSQFVLIWYANIPEETEFYMLRVEGGWGPVSYLLPLLHFAVPFFFLMSRHVKRNRKWLAVAAVWTLFMQLLDLYWVILPNQGLHGGGEGAHHPHFAPGITDLTALVGMAGAFLAAYGFFLAKNKVVAINDPRLNESLAHENY